MSSILSPLPSPTLPVMSSSSAFSTPVAASTLKRSPSQLLEPPLLKRKRDHSYCAPVASVRDASGHSTSVSFKSRLPMLDISDFHQSFPLPAQDGDDIPKISLRPRTTLFQPRDDVAQQLVQDPPRSVASLASAPLAQQQEETLQEESDRSEPVVEAATTNNSSQIPRRSSFSFTTSGTPLLRRSLSLQFNMRRLSIGSCTPASNTGCQSVSMTPVNTKDGRSCHVSKSIEKLSIPSLEDGSSFFLGDDENIEPWQPLAPAQPPQAKRGGLMVFDYLATALRLPDVAFGV